MLRLRLFFHLLVTESPIPRSQYGEVDRILLAPDILLDEKVSPKSSPGEQFGGNNRAMRSVGKEVAKTACFPMKNG